MSLRRGVGRETSVFALVLTMLVASVGGCATSADSGGSSDEVRQAAAPNGQMSPCDSSNLNGKKARGDVIESARLAPSELLNPNQIAYRVRYVSSVRDNTDLRGVCGIVVLPDSRSGIAAFNKNPELVSWSHGTVGLLTSCQPGQHPKSGVFGPMPGGIGSVVADKQSEYWQSGALQTLVDGGKVVTASDYYSGLGRDTDFQPYMAARVAAANSIDLITAAQQLIETGKDDLQLSKPVKTVLWGHSQGGATAMFAGQLWQAGYQPRKTESGQGGAQLVGIALAAPASNLVGTPKTQALAKETGLGDAIMHSWVNPLGQAYPDVPASYALMDEAIDSDPNDDLTDASLNVIPIAPILFTQISQGWLNLVSAKVEPKDSQLPAFRSGTGGLTNDVLTDVGKNVATKLSQMCVTLHTKQDVIDMWNAIKVFYPYGRQTAFFKPDFTGTKMNPGVERTCADPKRPQMYTDWCRWLAWNSGGPNSTVTAESGQNPYHDPPVLPGGNYVPIYIAQGTNDQIVVCRGQGLSEPDASAPCMARALFKELKASSNFCSKGSLTLQYFGQFGHMGVMAASSSNAKSGSRTFAGSPVYDFVDRAFAGATTSGCRIELPDRPVNLSLSPDLLIDGKKLVKNPDPLKIPVTDSPIVTWSVLAHDDDAVVTARLKGSENTVRVPYGEGKLDLRALPGWNKRAEVRNFTLKFQSANGPDDMGGYAYRYGTKVATDRVGGDVTKPLENGSEFRDKGLHFDYRDGSVTFRSSGIITVNGVIDGNNRGVIDIQPKAGGKGRIKYYINHPDPSLVTTRDISNLVVSPDLSEITFTGRTTAARISAQLNLR